MLGSGVHALFVATDLWSLTPRTTPTAFTDYVRANGTVDLELLQWQMNFQKTPQIRWPRGRGFLAPISFGSLYVVYSWIQPFAPFHIDLT